MSIKYIWPVDMLTLLRVTWHRYRALGAIWVIWRIGKEITYLIKPLGRILVILIAPLFRLLVGMLYPFYRIARAFVYFAADRGVAWGYFEQATLRDVRLGISNWDLWGRMGIWEVRRRYRRTVLGPFWATLSMAIFIGSLGFLYAKLWNQDDANYLPYLTTGFLAWMPISAMVAESGMVLISASGILQQMRQPYTMFVCAMICRNIVVFGHHMVVYILVVLAFDVPVNWYTPLALIGIMLLIVNAVWVGLLLGAVCARYRDIQPLIGNMLQILLFITPIFYPAEMLGRRGIIIAQGNPFYHFVEVIRTPLLGKAPAMVSYIFVAAITVVGWLVMLLVYRRIRRRICYWV